MEFYISLSKIYVLSLIIYSTNIVVQTKSLHYLPPIEGFPTKALCPPVADPCPPEQPNLDCPEGDTVLRKVSGTLTRYSITGTWL